MSARKVQQAKKIQHKFLQKSNFFSQNLNIFPHGQQRAVPFSQFTNIMLTTFFSSLAFIQLMYAVREKLAQNNNILIISFLQFPTSLCLPELNITQNCNRMLFSSYWQIGLPDLPVLIGLNFQIFFGDDYILNFQPNLNLVGVI